MAYTRALNAATQFGDPLVLSVTANIMTAETNLPIKIPWDGVDLTYAYAVTTTITTTGDCTIVLNKTSSAGTVIGTATITESGSAVGDIDEIALVAAASRTNLLNSDIINIKLDGAADAGQIVVFLYFEPSQYQ
jgi:hypothetical protein